MQPEVPSIGRQDAFSQHAVVERVPPQSPLNAVHYRWQPKMSRFLPRKGFNAFFFSSFFFRRDSLSLKPFGYGFFAPLRRPRLFVFFFLLVLFPRKPFSAFPFIAFFLAFQQLAEPTFFLFPFGPLRNTTIIPLRQCRGFFIEPRCWPSGPCVFQEAARVFLAAFSMSPPDNHSFVIDFSPIFSICRPLLSPRHLALPKCGPHSAFSFFFWFARSLFARPNVFSLDGDVRRAPPPFGPPTRNAGRVLPRRTSFPVVGFYGLPLSPRCLLRFDGDMISMDISFFPAPLGPASRSPPPSTRRSGSRLFNLAGSIGLPFFGPMVLAIACPLKTGHVGRAPRVLLFGTFALFSPSRHLPLRAHPPDKWATPPPFSSCPSGALLAGSSFFFSGGLVFSS